MLIAYRLSFFYFPRHPQTRTDRLHQQNENLGKTTITTEANTSRLSQVWCKGASLVITQRNAVMNYFKIKSKKTFRFEFFYATVKGL